MTFLDPATPLTTTLIIAQAIGLAAMALDLVSASQKDDRRMVLFSAAGCATFAVHYFMLGAFSGMFAELLNASRNLISQKWKKRWIGFLFVGFNIFMMFFADSAVALLPYTAGVIISLSLYNLSGIKLRMGYIAGFSLWLIYTIVNGSIGGMIMFTIAIILYATNIYRIRKDALL